MQSCKLFHDARRHTCRPEHGLLLCKCRMLGSTTPFLPALQASAQPPAGCVGGRPAAAGAARLSGFPAGQPAVRHAALCGQGRSCGKLFTGCSSSATGWSGRRRIRCSHRCDQQRAAGAGFGGVRTAAAGCGCGVPAAQVPPALCRTAGHPAAGSASRSCRCRCSCSSGSGAGQPCSGTRCTGC